MILSSFKESNEILVSISPLPKKFIFDSYVRAWQGVQYSFGVFLFNSVKLVVPVVILTVISSVFIGYGFARFEFPFKNLLFSLMLATLMLPHAVVIIPRYILFSKFGWINTYYPFIVPAAFGSAFFIYMMVQFIRGLPRELDESAYMDGCGPLGILLRIIVPLLKPAVISAVIFQFVWTWNNFFDSLIFINSISKFTAQLALRMSMDVGGDIDWAALMAKSTMVLIPPVIVFFIAQRYFVEGIATSGMKN
jgi:oligogalacturonide transport system permease protein